MLSGSHGCGRPVERLAAIVTEPGDRSQEGELVADQVIARLALALEVGEQHRVLAEALAEPRQQVVEEPVAAFDELGRVLDESAESRRVERRVDDVVVAGDRRVGVNSAVKYVCVIVGIEREQLARLGDLGVARCAAAARTPSGSAFSCLAWARRWAVAVDGRPAGPIP